MAIFLKKGIFILNMIILLLLSSCQKTPINGNLDGQWQVIEVYPNPNVNIIKENLYYCFSLHVCQLTFYGDIFTDGNMKYDGDKLFLDFPTANSPESVEKLKQYGIYENPVTFTIEHIDKKKLILRDGEITITLRKF